MHGTDAVPTDEKNAKPKAPPDQPSEPVDPAFTGMPAKEGGGKLTEQEKYKDHDR
ncbi:MAG: hypothetical protein JWN44_1304 [Myxococcales bacterium]|nr:hypothetical protein [Myxococcales bacterium]